MKKRIRLIWLVGLCLPMGMLAIQQLLFRRPSLVSGCPDWVLSQLQPSTQFIHAEKVVIEPWQGRHHVFAVFKIPEGYKPNSMFIVNANASSFYCGSIKPDSRFDRLKDHREVSAHLRTRTALWLMLKGQLNQLEQPRHWKLAIFKR